MREEERRGVGWVGESQQVVKVRKPPPISYLHPYQFASHPFEAIKPALMLYKWVAMIHLSNS